MNNTFAPAGDYDNGVAYFNGHPMFEGCPFEQLNATEQYAYNREYGAYEALMHECEARCIAHAAATGQYLDGPSDAN